MRSLSILIGLLALLAHPLAAARRLTADDLFALQDIAEIRASPDGSIVLFTATTTDLKANRTTTRLMRISQPGAEPAAVADAPEDAHNLRWSKDGSRLAFLAGK